MRRSHRYELCAEAMTVVKLFRHAREVTGSSSFSAHTRPPAAYMGPCVSVCWRVGSMEEGALTALGIVDGDAASCGHDLLIVKLRSRQA
jgi:hypothetical protein